MVGSIEYLPARNELPLKVAQLGQDLKLVLGFGVAAEIDLGFQGVDDLLGVLVGQSQSVQRGAERTFQLSSQQLDLFLYGQLFFIIDEAVALHDELMTNGGLLDEGHRFDLIL